MKSKQTGDWDSSTTRMGSRSTTRCSPRSYTTSVGARSWLRRTYLRTVLSAALACSAKTPNAHPIRRPTGAARPCGCIRAITSARGAGDVTTSLNRRRSTTSTEEEAYARRPCRRAVRPTRSSISSAFRPAATSGSFAGQCRPRRRSAASSRARLPIVGQRPVSVCN
jgi:hypothetical protein